VARKIGFFEGHTILPPPTDKKNLLLTSPFCTILIIAFGFF